MNSLQVIKFKDDFLEVVTVAGDGAVAKIDNDYFVSVKKVCENLSIKSERQIQKLKSDEAYEARLIEAQTNGGVQKVFCIPLDKLNGWLFSINPNKVKPEVKQKLIAYKKECFEVLHNHFLHKLSNRQDNQKDLSYYHNLQRENIELKRAINRITQNQEKTITISDFTDILDEAGYELEHRYKQALKQMELLLQSIARDTVINMHRELTKKLHKEDKI